MPSRDGYGIMALADLDQAIHEVYGVGVSSIAQERERQILQETYTPEHDQIYTDNQLAWAAMAYLLPAKSRSNRFLNDPNGVPIFWPWQPNSWKPGDRIRELEKAGALIAAEIDRLHGNSSSA